ncbi:tetratricopeptide repeat protein [Chitinibacter sp. SCUT-21]|uniref:tetratricopeptide repeat protein n=1 Tax=Chitinibacter sp. SCUT-21 TaxID=2970891 RepID=UPI0035A6D899
MGQFNLRAQIKQTLDIAKTLVHSNPSESIRIALQAKGRAEMLGRGDLETEAALVELMAYRAMPQTPPEQIEAAALATIALAQRHQQDDIWIEAMNTHADILYGTNQFDAAMDYWLRLLEAGIDRDWPYARVVAYIGIGKLFWTFEDPQSCLAYSDKAQQEIKLINRIEPKVCLMINLAAYAYQRRQYYLAHQYLDQAEALLEGIAFCEYEPEIYYYRAYLRRAEGKLDVACELFKRALTLNGHTSNVWARAVAMIGLGELYLTMNMPHKAQYFMSQAMEMTLATPNIYRYLLMQAYEGLAKCYQATGQTELEFQHWGMHFDLADELLQHGMNQRLASFKRQSLQLRVHELEAV